DITGRKELEQALLTARDAADSANHAKSAFLATMSHDIRTPLNAVLGMAELLADTQLTEEQSHHVTTINRAGEALLALINDVLDLSKIEAGQIHLESQVFELDQMVRDTADILAGQAVGKGLDLTCDLPPSTRRRVRGDSQRLRQVLLNLLGNAIKFTPRGSVTLRVEPGDEADTYLFSVADTGIGIPQELHEEIFRPFSQGAASTTRRFGGTGLGLTICRQMVRLMGGRLWVNSTPGEGSIFLFLVRLPEGTAPGAAEAADTPTGHAPPREGVASPPAGGAPQALRILLVDDSSDNRQLIEAFLKNTPHEVVQAENGLEAVQIYMSRPFDVVLMDIQMPVLDGIEATHRIRLWEQVRRLPPATVVALTAHAMRDIADRAMEAGCNLHLPKPIRKARLLSELDAIDQARR
ncbi:MAG: ATP-binding protein, partial [Magnetococcus sp. WYHC-3]